MFKCNSEKFCMPKTNSSWIENAHSYLIKHCLFSLMKPCSLATLSLPTCGILRGSFQSPLLPAQLVTAAVSTLTLESTEAPHRQPVCMMQPQQCGSSNRPCTLWLKLGRLGRLPGQHQEGSQGEPFARTSRWQWPTAA